mmetsp:Transcript_80609/g.195422  ORF Transcript_80609/g.195422 Transcript_80609/m.195422 type:complete len:213 (-) Transcript_80609:26-664(-)
MSGLRYSKPGVFSISCVDEWMRALRNSAVAIQVAACAPLVGRTCWYGKPPSSRRDTSSSAASTSGSTPGRRTRPGCVVGGPSALVMSLRTLTWLVSIFRAASLRASRSCSPAAPMRMGETWSVSLKRSQRRFCCSTRISVSTAFTAAPASSLMSGWRYSCPGVLIVSLDDEWMRALRYCAVAIQVAACAAPLVVSRRSRGSEFPPMRRRVTS